MSNPITSIPSTDESLSSSPESGKGYSPEFIEYLQARMARCSKENSMAKNPWTPEEDAELLNRRAAGENHYAIGEAMGRSPRGVKARWDTLRKRRNVSVPWLKGRKPWTAEEENELLRRRPSETVETIAAALDRTPSSIKARLLVLRDRDVDVPTMDPGPRPGDREEVVSTKEAIRGSQRLAAALELYHPELKGTVTTPCTRHPVALRKEPDLLRDD